MPEPTKDPEVEQVLSAIRQLIEQGRPSSRPSPLLLTPELRVGDAEPDPVPVPPRPVDSGVPGPRSASSPSRGSALAASPGPVRDTPAEPPFASAPKAQAAGGLLVLERPVLTGTTTPGVTTAAPLPLLVLGTHLRAHEADQRSDAGGASEGSLPVPPEADAATPLPVAVPPSELQHAPPRPLPTAVSGSAEALALPGDAASPAPQELPPKTEPGSSPASALRPEDAAAQADPLIGPDADSDVSEGYPPAPEDSEGSRSRQSAPETASQLPDLDLSAFMPLAGLPPSIALLDRSLPEPLATPPEAVQDEVPVAGPDLSQPDSEEPAAWTEPDWPELRPHVGRSEPTALPEDDLAGLLPGGDSATAAPVETDTPDPEDSLRERVVLIVREEIQREIGDLRQVVRQEVRDVLTERERP